MLLSGGSCHGTIRPACLGRLGARNAAVWGLAPLSDFTRMPLFPEKFTMPQFLCRSWSWTILLIALCGCSADNSLVQKGKITQYEQNQATLNRNYQELTARAAKLDQDNQEYSRLVAQWQQQAKVNEDKLAALQDQLRSVNNQLAQVKTEKESTEKKVQAMTASVQRQGGVSITPNNSLLLTLPAINLPEVFVRQDGDVIRVELPANRLFEMGSNRLRPGGAEFVAAAAGEVLRAYPDQMIAVEGHTDSDPVTGGQYRSNRELSSARAMAVYDVLITRARFDDKQLTVVGHGENRPVVSNGSPGGKQRNSRVELVIYPDKRPGR
jgi:flagellar motor protein MotB